MKKKLFMVFFILIYLYPYAYANNKISNLIMPVSYFVNHVKQLEALKKNLHNYRKASIVGISGMGKTQLARMYVYDNKESYDLIWFLDCNLNLNEEFLKLAKSINGNAKARIISENIALAKKEVLEYLSSKTNWLIIFDNLKINDNAKVKDFIHWEHNGHVIFCSQDNEMLPHSIVMNAFHNKESIMLAKKLLEKDEPQLASFLADEFQGYPVLIVQGAQLINKVKGLSKMEYINKIKQSSDKIKFNIELAINEIGPDARKLLNKIALINNQSFSKSFLSIITDNKDTLENDLFLMSKFLLISNIDSNQSDPIFEMHDLIADKINELNKNKKDCLDDIITKLINFLPKDILKGHIYRNAKTIHENIEIILENVGKHNSDILKIMQLNITLLADYINTHDYHRSEKIVNWFNENEKAENFKLRSMNNEEKRAYAEFQAFIGGYYNRRYVDYNTSLQYYFKALEVIKDVEGYELLRCNMIYNVARNYISLGQTQKAETNIQIIEKMFQDGLVDKPYMLYIHLARARLFLLQDQLKEALDQNNKALENFFNNGIKPEDFLLANTYLLKAEILNSSEKYQEAQKVAHLLEKMCTASSSVDIEVLARTYTQLARSQLGQGELTQALTYVNKAIAIFLADKHRNPENANFLDDPDLAASYVTQGDIYMGMNRLSEALESYRAAQGIYFHLYKDNSKNVAQVSYLYTQGAKASCKKKDSYYYQSFMGPQIKEFGIDHPNTSIILKYCKKYDLDSWLKKD